MNTKCKFFITAAGLVVSIFSATAVNAATTTLENIDVILEQQENTSNDKIRYISTLELSNNAKLSDITKIDMQLSLSKSGETTKYAEKSLTSVYDTITGTNGKAKAQDTYYAVFTVTDLAKDYPGWNLSATFEYNYSDGTSEETNTVNYRIPDSYQLTSSGSGSFVTTSECFADSVQDGQILQCFCWSYNEIMNFLPTIADQGFTAIQTSPVQVCKEATAGKNAKGSWWAYYQPAAFTIDDTGDNALGTPEEFQAMCEMAHSYGVKVLVDVVANHLGNQWVADSLCERAYYYEWEIAGMSAPADKNAKEGEPGYIPYTGEYWKFSNGEESTVPVIDTYYYKDTLKFHPYLIQDNDEPGNVTKGNIGMMDLDTSDPVVQDAVADYLEELINYGVDGFRFDAAKHIETPLDSDTLKSDFWPNVMERANAAAAAKGRDVYAYGEILNRPGIDRSLSGYTNYGVAITDSGMGHNIVENGGSGHGSFNGADGNNYADYRTQMVTWAESHDNYMGTQDTHNKSEAIINRSYAILASRKDFATLYCARFEDYEKSNLGSVACLNGWSYSSVGAVNKFHNFYAKNDADESCYDSNGYTVTERFINSKSTSNGVVIVGNSGNCSVNVPHMADGEYTDYVTGSKFRVSGGVLSGTVGAEQVAVVYNNTSTTEGSCSISSAAEKTFYTGTMSASYIIRNAKSATLTINGTNHDITSGATITFGYDMAVGDTKTITITAVDKNNNNVTKSFTYTKVAAPLTYNIHFDKPDDWSKAYAYLYTSENATADKVEMTLDTVNNKYFVEYEEKYTHISFGNGTTQTVLIPLTPEDKIYGLVEYDGYLYFDNTSSWSKVNAYMWTDDTHHNAEWPGAEIYLDNATGYFKVDPAGYTSIIFNNGSTQTDDLTVYTDYSGVYTPNSKYGLRVVEAETCAHTYSSPVWTWTGYSEAKAAFTCTACEKTTTINASVVSEVTVEPTTTSTGTKVYTATVTFNGTTYTDTKSETLPIVDNTIQTVARVEATCTTNGNILYYIKNDKYYSDSYCTVEISLADTVIPATGHTHSGDVIVSKSNLSATCDTCGETFTLEFDSDTIYFVNVDDWANVTAYAWKGAGGSGNQNNAWPGVTMTDTGLTYNGHKIYSYKNTDGYAKIIFSNNGSSQTGDLIIPTDANCYYNGSFDYVFVS